MQSTQSPNSPARGDDRDGGENARRHQPRWRKNAGRFTGDLRVRHSRKKDIVLEYTVPKARCDAAAVLLRGHESPRQRWQPLSPTPAICRSKGQPWLS